jgi:hypothetical protein
MFKKILVLFFLFSSSAFAEFSFTDAQLKANYQSTLNCTAFPSSNGSEYYSSVFSDFTSNAQSVVTPFVGNNLYRNVTDNTAAINNVTVGWSPTTNLNTAVNPHVSTSNGAITVNKAINIWYTYGGVQKVFQIPVGTYWGTATSGTRKTDGTTHLLLAPSSAIPLNTALSFFGKVMSSTSNGFTYVGHLPETGNKLKITSTMPNGVKMNFYMHCNSLVDAWVSLN